MKEDKDKISVDTLFNVAKNVLKFFNLLDRGNKLSITNVAVIVCVTKMAIAPQVTIVDAGMLLISLLNYSHKRSESNKAAMKDQQDDLASFKEAVTKVVEVQNTITQDMVNVKQVAETISKQAEETKSVLSKLNLGQAFSRKS